MIENPCDSIHIWMIPTSLINAAPLFHQHRWTLNTMTKQAATHRSGSFRFVPLDT